MISLKPTKQQFKNKRGFFAILSFVIIGIELSIASFMKDSFVRPILGDFFVVILLYAIIRAATSIHPNKVAISVLIFAYLIELSQWLHLIDILGIKRNFYTDLILGSSFDWKDLLAYALGITVVYMMDIISIKKG